MIIKKYIEFGQEIEINVSASDFLEELRQPSMERTTASIINDIAQCLTNIEDYKIKKELSAGQRKLINDFLLRQAERYR